MRVLNSCPFVVLTFVVGCSAGSTVDDGALGDAEAGTLPWAPDWVRELLTTYPRELHWNTFRICVGRAPELWYDIDLLRVAGLRLVNDVLEFIEKHYRTST